MDASDYVWYKAKMKVQVKDSGDSYGRKKGQIRLQINLDRYYVLETISSKISRVLSALA